MFTGATQTRSLIALVVLALVVAACGSDDETAEAAVDLGSPDAGEFTITLTDTLTEGSLSFAVIGSGEFPHALAIARGASYDDLPHKANGAVDIDALGDDFLGSTDNLETGQTAALAVDLESGDYVFFCPVEFGDQSHAGGGMVLSVTVG